MSIAGIKPPQRFMSCYCLIGSNLWIHGGRNALFLNDLVVLDLGIESD